MTESKENLEKIIKSKQISWGKVLLLSTAISSVNLVLDLALNDNYKLSKIRDSAKIQYYERKINSLDLPAFGILTLASAGYYFLKREEN